jgi:hypothetical protein
MEQEQNAAIVTLATKSEIPLIKLLSLLIKMKTSGIILSVF